jgi:multimeric flavodoxin WrbA
MKKILAIIGSARTFGNCELLVKAISKNISEEHELSLLRLTDFNIEHCDGCYKCLFDEMTCSKKDDLNVIISALCNADALITAIPTYFFKAHSTLHKLLDRGLAFYGHTEELWGKPAIGIGVCGIREKQGSTLLDIEKFLKVLQADVKKTVILNGRLPGDILLSEDNIKVIEELAQKLFGVPDVKNFSCPLCGGDTFRFLDETHVKCMLCSNNGTFSFVDNKPVLNMTIDGEGIYLNKEQSMNHLEWLRDMKNDYISQRKTLKEVRQKYIGNYHWIKP